MMTRADWADEDTEVAPTSDERRLLDRLEPTYELTWVEEADGTMVLRVRRVGTE